MYYMQGAGAELTRPKGGRKCTGVLHSDRLPECHLGTIYCSKRTIYPPGDGDCKQHLQGPDAGDPLLFSYLF